MPRYTFRGDTPRNVADIGVDVTPGEEFESSLELDGPLFELVTGKSAKGAKAPAEEPAVEVVPEPAPDPEPVAEVAAEPAPEPAQNPDEEVAQ